MLADNLWYSRLSWQKLIVRPQSVLGEHFLILRFLDASKWCILVAGRGLSSPRQCRVARSRRTSGVWTSSMPTCRCCHQKWRRTSKRMRRCVNQTRCTSAMGRMLRTHSCWGCWRRWMLWSPSPTTTTGKILNQVTAVTRCNNLRPVVYNIIWILYVVYLFMFHVIKNWNTFRAR